MKNSDIKVLQLIDSLDIGGAERMSVNIANALSSSGIKSFICATRKGGKLESMLDNDIELLILDKKATLDIQAISKLVKYIKENDIDIIHAHSSSFFTAVLCKPFTKVKIVWHDHNGLRDNVSKVQNSILKIFSYFFDVSISVNKQLLKWAKDNLWISEQNIIYIPNFATLPLKNNDIELPGNRQDRIVCLANLRYQKDHLVLLEAFSKVHNKYPDKHLFLVGEDKNDIYSKTIKQYIKNHKLEDKVHILGSRDDSADILYVSSIGVLSSKSEGLPVALLEYALAKLPVVCTDVGECSKVLGNGEYGKIVQARDSESFANALFELIENENIKEQFANKLHNYVKSTYSQEAVINRLIYIYKGILNG